MKRQQGVARVIPWIWTAVAVIVAVVFINAAVQKLVGDPAALAPFREIGMPRWLASLTGLGEIVGSVALIIPTTRTYGGLFLTMIMIGAMAVNLINGHPDYVWLNVVLIAASLLLAWQGRRRRYPIPGRSGGHTP